MFSTVKVPCDPAQVIVNHASFRVRLGPAPVRAMADTSPTPAIVGAVRPIARTGAGGRRAAPVVWSGRISPGDAAAAPLLQAVRNAAPPVVTESTGATQVLPRVTAYTGPRATVVAPRSPAEPVPHEMLVGPRPAAEDEFGAPGRAGEPQDRHGRSGDRMRHAWYPGRRMNLGIVLLPLRIFLGFISVYAGMSKLCDPVYFDGAARGSLVTWLGRLRPWALAEPLHDFALAHPVGSGLTIAFLQIIVGVLTILGLWQRIAASFGTLLSVALLVTVSWRTVAVYDTPDVIYLAAWSPLIIAGAPVYSVDGRLAGEAWRRLGPRVDLWDLRRRVLRRGAVVAAIVVGVTLVVGSTFGAAVRSTSTHLEVPGSGGPPTNTLPGSPLPEMTGTTEGSSRAPRTPSASAKPAGTPSAKVSPTPQARETESADRTDPPTQQQVAPPVRQPVTPPRHSQPEAPAPSSGGSSDSESGSEPEEGGAGALGGLLGSGPSEGGLLGAAASRQADGSTGTA